MPTRLANQLRQQLAAEALLVCSLEIEVRPKIRLGMQHHSPSFGDEGAADADDEGQVEDDGEVKRRREGVEGRERAR